MTLAKRGLRFLRFVLLAQVFIALCVLGLLYLTPGDIVPEPIADPRAGIVSSTSTPARIPVGSEASAPLPTAAQLVSASGAQPNLEQGMIPLAQAANVGRATPEAAVQTLFWATLNKDDAVLAACLILDADAREKILVYLDRLPPAARAAYSSPEHLAGLLMAYDILPTSAYQIISSKPVDGGTMMGAIVTVRLRRGAIEKETGIPLWHLGPEGWALPLTGKQMDVALKTLSAANLAPK